MSRHHRSTLSGLIIVAALVCASSAAHAQTAAQPSESATDTPIDAGLEAPESTATNGEESGRVASSQVALARFTSAIENREPVDSISFLTNDKTSLLFFSDLRRLKGETVTHRWEYKGEVMGEVAFEVRGDRWRVWSSKDLRPEWVGTWSVSIVKSDGEVLASESFSYEQ